MGRLYWDANGSDLYQLQSGLRGLIQECDSCHQFCMRQSTPPPSKTKKKNLLLKSWKWGKKEWGQWRGS